MVEVQTEDWIDECCDDGETKMAVWSSILAASNVSSTSPSVHHYYRHDDVTTTSCSLLLPSVLQQTHHCVISLITLVQCM